MTKTTVLLVFGGESPEHDVSIESGKNVFHALNTDLYTINLCFIDKQGRWWLLNEWQEHPYEHTTTQLVAAPGTKHFLTVPGSKTVQIDIIFSVLHGRNGEDGTIQGLAELMHIPIVGCGVEASAVGMDKELSKTIASNYVKVAPWFAIYGNKDVSSQIRDRLEESRNVLSSSMRHIGQLPWFVKPSRAGSSVGVTKIESEDELLGAVHDALQYDNTVLVESAIVGREIEVAVLGSTFSPKASSVGEIIPGDEFYSYDDKYSASSTSKVITNPDMPEHVKDSLKRHSEAIFSAIGCSGLARIDFFLTAKGDIYFNEINTMPGFTNISMYPKLWQYDGLTYPQLISRLIELAVE